ncbi:MAG: hypothetical protein QY314_05030 [Candidatus Dojkabacteria bacterium]|nr:MAG: hypothetical protein QY314_05030 [Candidatus Dojkabacteria bacterium]
MRLPHQKEKKYFEVSNIVVALFVVLTLVLVIVQFQVSSSYEALAKRLGVFDAQSQSVNITYLDYEEQSAIMRSSNFLISEKGQEFTSSPAKVIYIEPISVETVVSQK